MQEVYIVGAARTPIGSFLGTLKDMGPVELGITAVQGALEKAGVQPDLVDEVACGMIYKGGVKGNPGRQIQIKCNMPATGFAYTVDQQCGSGMKAFDLACQSIMLGKSGVAVAVGTESMSQAAYVLKKARSGYRMGNGELIDTLLHDGLICAMLDYHMAITAETLAQEYGITRQEQDELALLSNQRACAAIQNGVFREEIVPVKIAARAGETIVDTDEHPRADTSLEKLAKMRPAFQKDGTVTAGNASGVNDGAAALVLVSGERLKSLHLQPLARVVTVDSIGVEPRIMGIGPAFAVPKALKNAGLKPEDIGYYEINEAFAAQFLAVNRVLKLDMERVNANGSGIGLGHPVGCTGARILVTLLAEMQRRHTQYGLASLCVGGGPAMATVLERM